MNPGDQLAGGRYVLDSRITRSGMGEVWLARQQGGGVSKTVVVKMIHPDLNAHREAQQRFFDEAQIVARINHPHVVQFYEFGEQENMLYQVMEYIEGYAFSQITEQAKSQGATIPLPVICRLLADAAQGLGHIHDMTDEQGQRQELVHRDISPQNLLVSKTGTLKIIDFGIVKAKQKTSRTRTGVIVGKLQYMSPEQLSSEALDHRSDIYSLGLVLYEMLTLESRFRGSNLLEIFYEAFNEPLPQIVNLRPDCPQALIECVHRALAQEKENRFAHAYDMQDLLERYLHQQGSPCNQRDVASFLSNLFAGNEHVREETTRIHAASLLSEFQQSNEDPMDDTLAANIAQLDDLGDLDGMDPLDGTMVSPVRGSRSNQRITSPPHTLNSLSSVQESFEPHTMSSIQPGTVETSLPHTTLAPSHTLKGYGVDSPATQHDNNTQRWVGAGIDTSPAQQQWSNVTSPHQQTAIHGANKHNPAQDVTNPGMSIPSSAVQQGLVSEETVVLSTALMKDLDRKSPSHSSLPTTPPPPASPSGGFAPPTIQQPRHPPPPGAGMPTTTSPRSKPSKAKAAKPSQPQAQAAKPSQGRSTIFIGMGLGFIAFLLGIFLVYFFMGR
ncbi:MAG: serine/threonine protein kinase [Deltaproteobacteria bacterium]|nr:MAG: serine/threonine protein kinase [Deltaproteobacteria bacterium]